MIWLYIYNPIMSTLSIRFDFTGSFTQEIKILNGEDPKDFFQKIRSFKYLTSASGKDIIKAENGEKVGSIEDQDTCDGSDIDGFELLPG